MHIPSTTQRLMAHKFRRSMKSDKHDSAKPVQIAIPQKDAIAIEPPKKVRPARFGAGIHS